MHWSGFRTGPDDALDQFGPWLREKRPVHLNNATHVIFTAYHKGHVRGEAYTGTICIGVNNPVKPDEVPVRGNNGPYELAVVMKDSYNRTIGWLIAHELGHVLGMRHSQEWEDGISDGGKEVRVPENLCHQTEEERDRTKTSYIVRNLIENPNPRADYRRVWTICNRCDLLSTYQKTINRYGSYCLDESNSFKNGEISDDGGMKSDGSLEENNNNGGSNGNHGSEVHGPRPHDREE